MSIPNIDWSGSFHDCSSVLIDEALCGILTINMKFRSIKQINEYPGEPLDL